MNLRDYCTKTGNENLLSEWNYEKNQGIKPEEFSASSRAVVWWKCEKGHEWQARIDNRTNSGNGCPYCANKRLLKGYNDLETTFPDIAKEWHPQKNGSLLPSDVLAITHKKVWWKCEKGHEWCAEIASRTSKGAGCPVCANKVIITGENDLVTLFPDIAKEWHPLKNGIIKPEDVSPFSNRKVWWMCEKGHEWQAVISSRTFKNAGCPFCSNRKVLPGFNDLATTNPKLASEWHPTLNGKLKPDMVTYGSRKKVWWICEKGHIWKASVYSRAGKRGTGCPVCAGISASRYEIYRGNV